MIALALLFLSLLVPAQVVAMGWWARVETRRAVEALRRQFPWGLPPPAHLEREDLPPVDGEPCAAPVKGSVYHVKTTRRGPAWVIERGAEGWSFALFLGFDEAVSRWLFVTVAQHEADGIVVGDVDPATLIACRQVRVVDVFPGGGRMARMVDGGSLPQPLGGVGGWRGR